MSNFVTRARALGFILILSLMIGCGDDTESSDGGGGGGATSAKPGMLTGTILDERGKPISVPGVKYHVSISGNSEKSGEKVQYNPAVKPDGTYESKLVPGTYHSVSAKIEVKFNNNSYMFDLDPVQDNTSDREAANGIHQDFVWKVTGPHFRYRETPDPTNHTNWYGASVKVRLSGYREDLKKGVEAPPAGTKFTFTLKPVGKQIDGVDAKEMKFERTFTDRRDLDNNVLNDIPIAIYKMTGVETTPDGKIRKLVFETSYAKYEPEMRIEFPYSEILHGPHIPIVAFDRE
jgi:hypothetical protein